MKKQKNLRLTVAALIVAILFAVAAVSYLRAAHGDTADHQAMPPMSSPMK